MSNVHYLLIIYTIILLLLCLFRTTDNTRHRSRDIITSSSSRSLAATKQEKTRQFISIDLLSPVLYSLNYLFEVVLTIFACLNVSDSYFCFLFFCAPTFLLKAKLPVFSEIFFLFSLLVKSDAVGRCYRQVQMCFHFLFFLA